MNLYFHNFCMFHQFSYTFRSRKPLFSLVQLIIVSIFRRKSGNFILRQLQFRITLYVFCAAYETLKIHILTDYIV